MQTTTVTPEQVLELAAALPREQLAQWYAYGLSIRSATSLVSQAEMEQQQEAAMWKEFAMWEAASDEDWSKFERRLAEEADSGFQLDATSCP